MTGGHNLKLLDKHGERFSLGLGPCDRSNNPSPNSLELCREHNIGDYDMLILAISRRSLQVDFLVEIDSLRSNIFR